MRQSVNNKIGKFTNNDILSSSAWSSVIHQPSQDSEPEDLPSTVDINAIKEFSTPVNASAQTPLHGDANSITFSDDQNAGESGSDSDSESDSGNSENEIENHGSGADSGSCSDSDSVSSHRSSCSSSKLRTSHSSRSNSPNLNDPSQKPFTLPKDCNLSEDSDDGEDVPPIAEVDTKKHTDYVPEKLSLPQISENLQAPKEADLGSAFSDIKPSVRAATEVFDFNVNKKSMKPIVETKKIPAAFSDSSSDSEMLPKQVVRDAINSIYVEPRSPYDSRGREERTAQEPFKSYKPTLTKDIKSTSKVSSYSSTPVDGHDSTNANMCASFQIFHGQEKRGPGRPRKNKIDTISKVTKEQIKNKNKKSAPAVVAHQTSMKVSDAIMPVLLTQTDHPRKQKKKKKKDAKERISNPELAKEIDDLIEFFSKKCLIEDKRQSLIDTTFPRHLTITRSKINQRNKDKNKKRKHSDKESESETSSLIPHDVKTKRRHKKSTTEMPKVHQTNFDQRLPLKKRHYHILAPPTNQNASLQTQNTSKTRVEKHVPENMNEESHKPNDGKSSITKPNEFSSLPPTLSSIKKEKPRKRTKNMENDTPPILDEYSRQPNSLNESTLSNNSVTSLLSTSVPSSKKPELITPLPQEPSSNVTSPGLKPPAGVFEPTRKLPASLLKYKKTSIDDMLVKLKEKLEGLESSSNNTSALIEKIGESVCEDENDSPFKRVLRPKRTNVEKEKENTGKKSKILKDVTIRLLKLPIANSSDPKELEDMKPKTIKRRKTRNRTGFPVLKKKKKKHQYISASPNVSNTVEKEDRLEGIIQNEIKIEQAATEVEKVQIGDKNRGKEKTEDSVPKDHKETGKLEVLSLEKEKPTVRVTRKGQPKKKEKMDEKEKVSKSELETKKKLPQKKKIEGKEILTEIGKETKTISAKKKVIEEKDKVVEIEKIPPQKKEKLDEKERVVEVEKETKKVQPKKKDKVVEAERSAEVEEMMQKSPSKKKETMEIKEEVNSVVEEPKNILRKKKEKLEEKAKAPPVREEKKCIEPNKNDKVVEKDRTLQVEEEETKKAQPKKKEKVEEKEKSVEVEVALKNILPKKKEKVENKEKIAEVEEQTPIRSLRKREPPKENLPKPNESKKFKNENKPKSAIAETKKVPQKDDNVDSVVYSGRLLRKREPPATDTKKLGTAVENKKKDVEKANNLAEKIKEDSTKESKTKKDVKVKEDPEKDELSDDSKKDVVPKKKRKYVQAGLFSDYFKEDKNTATDLKNRYIPYKSEDHPHGLLPPPPYFEEYVRRRRVDFKLPYDLWWLQMHKKLPGRDTVDSWKYRRIKMNVYYDVKPPQGYEAQACNCKMPEEKDKLGCGDDCINRVVYAECSPDLCPLKEKCSNQKIQKHNADSIKLSRFMTKDKGIGVKTLKFINAGEYIVEYVGEVVTDKEFKNRMTSLYKNDIHHYCLNLEGGLLIDGHRMGSDARFVNHSCEPNCEIQKWSVNGRFRMGLFAQRNIEPGEELTYDYNFSLFNPEEGQPCRCGSKECRGVIGGKSQRVTVVNASSSNTDVSSSTSVSQVILNSQTSKNSRLRPRKQTRKNSNVKVNLKSIGRRDSDSSGRVLPRRSALHLAPIESLTSNEKEVVRTHRIFMLRTFAKIQRAREQMDRRKSDTTGKKENGVKNGKSKQPIEFMRQLNALTQQRFIKTRGLAQVEDDPEINKTLQLANLFRTIYTFVISAKDENSGETFASFFTSLPSKQKLPMYYQRIEEPIDLTTVEKNIVTGVYKDVESFDKDMNKLIANNVKYYGRTSEHGIAAVRLRKAYNIAKLEHLKQVEEITGLPVPASFRPVQENPGDEEEDVIRCICGLYNDEGMMIQCERCLVWQHTGCVRASTDVEHYYCERCSLREVDYEIPLDVPPPEYPEPNERHYLTLMREDLQIRQGDTVYVLRDLRDPATNTRHTYRTIGTFKYEDCDILRVEQLWKTQNGDKFAFGHHYLRPCETFHEPTRKFFPNELLKRSVYETVPLDLIMGRCYVLDLRTYSRGRPVDADPEHIYICEFSVNKDMNTFHKMKSKQPCPVSTKSYAFEMYDTRLRPTRTYTPHIDSPTGTHTKASVNTDPPKSTISTNQNKGRISKPKEIVESQRVNDSVVDNSIYEDDLPLARSKDAKVDKQKQHLNSILLKLLAKKPCKSPLDVSYLLEMGRRNRTGKKSIQQGTTNV